MLKYGGTWSHIAKSIAKMLPGHRTGDSLRNRYQHLQKVVGAEGRALTSEDLHASKDALHGDIWNQEEGLILFRELERLGGQHDWKQIALKLPGRSAGAVRNQYARILARR